MCGFVVFFQPKRTFDKSLLSALGEDIAHRGPDSKGFLLENGIGGVFRRLSIIDPSKNSDQPMTQGDYTIFFNGEIYNYKEIKKDLLSRNIRFKSDGDTEVILKGYETYGKNIFKKLIGMFSIIIIDRKLQKALVVRDPLGIKPLYIYKKSDFVGISSEVKPLLRACEPEVDLDAFKELLTFGWAAGRHSNYKNIELILQGSLLEINLINSEIKEEIFNDIFEYKKIDNLNYFEIENSLNESIKDHTLSDVGYCLQLSGGVDSSYIASICAENTSTKLKTFSLTIDDEDYNEKSYQEYVIKKYNLEYYQVNFTGKDYAEELPQAIKHMEGPTPHGGCVALKFLNKKISKYSKVVLTGEGADELFGGYNRYKYLDYFNFINKVKKFIPRNLIPNFYPFKTLKKYKRTEPAIYSSVYFNYENLWQLMPEIIPLNGYRETMCNKHSDYLNKLRSVDQSCYLSSLLMRQDKMSMAHSVEARVPFTHFPLFNKINKINIKNNFFKKQTKPILKKIASKKLSKHLVYRKKNGLLSPYGKWFSDPNGAGSYLNYLDDSKSVIKGYMRSSIYKDFLTNIKKDINLNQNLIRKLVEIELWLRTINKPSGPSIKI